MSYNYKTIQEYVNSLPNNILELNLSDKRITKLSNKKLINLPDLSRFTQLQKLDCDNNELTSLPDNLPDSLQELNCGGNQLTYLPNHLPNSLQELNCGGNQLTYLPNHLPDSLQRLYCAWNKLTSLPNNLPNSLQILYCNVNALTSLPKHLPDSLLILRCSFNNLTSLPNLPNYLEILYCENNYLTSLTDLPNYLELLDCENNQLTYLSPNLPDSLEELNYRNNPELEIAYPLLSFLQTIEETNKYIQERNWPIIKEKAEKRMKILNPEQGGLVEKAIQWNMKPERIEKYLNEGYELDEIHNFI